MRTILLTLAASAILASAGPIFTVNQTAGAGSVTGSIQTDGTIGVLAVSYTHLTLPTIYSV